MRVYVVTFQLDGDTDRLAFSSNEYMVRGLISYIQRAKTRISAIMLRYFEEYQWEFPDKYVYWNYEIYC